MPARPQATGPSGPAAPGSGHPALAPGEWRTLVAACEALIPRRAGSDGPDWSAADLDVAARAAEAIATTGWDRDLADFRLLLRLLESPLSRALTGGPWGGGFSGLDRRRQEELLRRWSVSPIPRLRQGFQALKRLSAFMFCAGVDPQGHNPNWDLVGYTGPGPAPAPLPERELRPLAVSGDLELAADAVVVGSGAGGAVAAALLAARGLQVLVLEKGGYYAEADFSGRELEGFERLYLERGFLSTRDLGMAVLAGSCLGGGTVVNWAACLPPPPDVLDQWEREHGVAGATGPELAAAVTAVMGRLGVSDTAAAIQPESAAGRLLAGCAALGYHTAMMPLNLQGCGGEECGTCGFGCRRGTKQSTLKTYLVDAAAHGAGLVVNCTVDRVTTAGGAVTGVEGRVQAGGRRHALRVRAPRVVLAAGALMTPAVLLRSGLDNPQIGRNLHLHPVSALMGLFPHPVEMWKGPLLPAYCDQFARLDGAYGFLLETAPAHPGLAGIAVPWAGGQQWKQDMLGLRNAAGIIVLTRDRDGGRVTLDRQGRLQVDYWPSPFDMGHIRRGVAEAAAVMAAAGAAEVMTLHTPPIRARVGDPEWQAFPGRVDRQACGPNRLMVFSAHQMSTCRLGASPRSAVANPDGQVWGVRGLYVCDGSAFPTATGVNPMLSIMALSHWLASRIP